MSSKQRPVFGAVCLASVMFMNSASFLSSKAANRDDHSYLPPWMLDETGAIKKVDEKVAAVAELAMSDDPYPKYEAFPLKDGGGWYIVVTPRNHGAPYEIHGLASETEARDWIIDLREEHDAAKRFSGAAAETGQSRDQRNQRGWPPGH